MCISLCKFFITWNMYWSKLIEDLWEKFSTHKVFGNEFQKTRTKIGDSEGYWRLPSSPIVEKNMCISLCKFFLTWNMYWIHFSRYVQFITWNMYWSELIEDLCEKCSTSNVLYIQFQKTAARTPATVAWNGPPDFGFCNLQSPLCSQTGVWEPTKTSLWE